MVTAEAMPCFICGEIVEVQQTTPVPYNHGTHVGSVRLCTKCFKKNKEVLDKAKTIS